MVVNLSAATRQLLEQAVSSTPNSSAASPNSLPLARLTVVDSTLLLEPTTPGKPPIVFHCSRLVLDNLDNALTPSTFDANLTSPIPSLHSSGSFGPLHLARLRDTPVDASYQLTNAPLNLFSGVLGTVSSTGDLHGTLGSLTIAGAAQSPAFALDVSAHPFPATATFRARFDLTSGDFALSAASVHFLRTTADATGSITRQPQGRHIHLDLHIRDGRNEDLLTLLSTPRPVFLGPITLDSRIDVPTGSLPLIRRMTASGRASLPSLLWTNPAIQQQMDSLSMRAGGHARTAAAAHPADLPVIHSSLSGHFSLASADIAITHLVYTMPGAVILMDGNFPLLTSRMQFHGVARTIASASHMETGVARLLLKPISPFLKKNGTGMQVPISFSGEKSSPTLTLDLTHPTQDRTVSHQNPQAPHP